MLMKDKCVCLVLKLVNELLQLTLFVLNDLSLFWSELSPMISKLISESQSEHHVSKHIMM